MSPKGDIFLFYIIDKQHIFNNSKGVINLLIIKLLLFLILFSTSTVLGILISKKYVNRVLELKEFKSVLNVVKTKIRFTYEPLGEIFTEIANNFSNNVSNVLRQATFYMKTNNAGNSWKMAVENANINISKEDKEVLITLSKMLGKTDLEGQVNQIEQTENFLDMQIEKAENIRIKNERLYKTLGMVTGAGLVILLI